MLAQRISSINSLSALCEETGANIDELSNAIGMDHRIGPHFLKASVGFGGSCFQKDILNLVYLCKYFGLDEVAEFWNQVIKINDYQKNRFTQKIIDISKSESQTKTISILGWAFKPNTNDSRESPAITVTSKLLKVGFEIYIFDPKVSKKRIIGDLKNLSFNTSKLIICDSAKQAIENTRFVAVLTEWKQFEKIDFKKHKVFNSTRLKINSKYNYQIGHE